MQLCECCFFPLSHSALGSVGECNCILFSQIGRPKQNYRMSDFLRHRYSCLVQTLMVLDPTVTDCFYPLGVAPMLWEPFFIYLLFIKYVRVYHCCLA